MQTSLMYLFEFYILRRVLILFFSVFTAAIGLTWTVQILSRINFLITSGQTFITFFRFSSLFIPSAIALVMPFALVIAVAQSYSSMNRNSELVAMNAAGCPRFVLWRPILLIGLVLSLFSFVLTNFIAPYSRLTMRELMAAARGDLITTLIQEGSFQELGPKIYLEVGKRGADGSIGQLFIADERDPNLDLFYYAIHATITTDATHNDPTNTLAANPSGHFLVLKDGEVERRDHKTGNVSIIKFDSYSFDLREFIPANQAVTLYPKDLFLKDLLYPNLEDPYFQRYPLQYTAELHKRFTDWLYPLVFALIALAASGDARSSRETRIPASFSAVSICLFVYWLAYFFAEQAENDPAYIPLFYLLPLTVSGIMIFMLITHHPIDIPSSWREQIYRILHWFRKRDKASLLKNKKRKKKNHSSKRKIL